MHWIQKEILKKLAMSDQLRYSDLKPKDVEGNLFVYHLNQLLAEKLIEKKNNLYTLTTVKGKNHVSSMSFEAGTTRKQPKIVTMIVARNNDGNYAFFKWKRQPYRNLVSFPFGKVHFGKSILDITSKEASWKLGLKGDLAYKGDAYIKDGEKDHYLAHIFSLTNFYGELRSSGLQGEPFWGNPHELGKNETVPGFEQLLKIIETEKNIFFKEIEV